MSQLDAEAQELLGKRRGKGNALMAEAWGRWPYPDERESAASDAISDILTAILGPAGTVSYGGALEYDEDTISKAHDLLYHALTSYRGDAEDYYREPDPGEYGHEAE